MLGSDFVTVYAYQGSEEGEFEFKHARSDPADLSPDHLHTCYEIIYLLSGDIHYVIEGYRYPLSPNDVLVINCKELHRSERFSTAPYERIMVHFHPRFLRDFQSCEYNLFGFLQKSRLGVGNLISGQRQDTTEFYEYLKAIERYIAAPRPESTIMVRTLFVQALVCLNRYVENQLPVTTRDTTIELCQYDEKIVEILGYIHRNLDADLSLSRLEDRFSVSKHYLCRLFKRNTGYTVHEYIRTKRVMHAAGLMREGATALEAAGASGFNDYSNFYKAFHQVFGTSPVRYRPGFDQLRQ